MSRPTRSRRAPSRFSEDDNIPETPNRKMIAVVVIENMESRKDVINNAMAKERSVKGNLLAGKKILTQRQPALRDRTNLPADALNVDILMKKGADDKTSKKTTIRRIAKSTAVEEHENDTQGQKNLRNNAKNPLVTINSKETAKKVKKITTVTKNKDDSLVIESENTPEKRPVKVVPRNIIIRTTKTSLRQNSEKSVENGQRKSLRRSNLLGTPEEVTTKILVNDKDDSLVNDTDDAENSDDITEQPVKTVAKKIGKRTTVSKILQTKQSEKGVKNRKKKPLVRSSGSETTEEKVTTDTTNKNNKDDSLVNDNDDDEDSDDITKQSVKSVTKKIGKRTVVSKISLTKKSDKSMENEKKKSLRRSSALIKKGDKVTSTGNKFFKSKGMMATAPKNLASKKISSKKRSSPNVSISFRLRQTTLSESFAKHSTKKALRPREAQVNYRDQSTILDNTLANNENTNKAPIYKTSKIGDKSSEEGNEIYEFHFDRNDSREKIKKKRKKRVVKNVNTKKTRVPKSLRSKKIIISKPVVATKIVDEINKIDEETEFPEAFDEPMAMNLYPAIIVKNFDEPQSTVKRIQSKAAETQTRKLKSQPEKLLEVREKPKIIESKELTNDMRVIIQSTSNIPKPVETRPPRETNAFIIRPSIQYKNMLGHALLNKSLSPINKALEDFDPSSPWRPPIITGQMFSRINNIVQSTPQIRKTSSILEKKNPTDGKSQLVLAAKPTKIIQMKDEKVERVIIKPVVQQKIVTTVKSPRKFGTEISNVNISNSPLGLQQENNDKALINRESPRKIAAVAAPRSLEMSLSSMSDGNYDDYVDKENSLPVTPKKSFKSPKKLVVKKSPLRAMNKLKTASKENWEPQPGPSGLQKRNSINQARILQQSNLNNFLNIDELPSGTKISTAHGIFADIHSTPITVKPAKPLIKEANIDNAFGFDDTEGFDIDVSPIKNDLLAQPAAAAAARKIVTNRLNTDDKSDAPARFSIGNIRTHLRPILTKENKITLKRIEEKEKELREEREMKIVTDNENESLHDFTNTFDVENENPQEKIEEIPLFADLEPVHFKQPPRHSYKRKRILTFDFTENEDEDGVTRADQEGHGKKKKRKITKAQKQQDKKIEDWAKGLNSTFEEIDHFDLIVE